MWQVAARMMKTADPAATVKTNAPRAQAPRMRPTAALHHSAAQALRPPAGRRCSRPGFLEQAVLLPGVFRIDRHGNRPRSEGSFPSVAIPSIAIIERFPSSSHGRAVLAAAADIVSWGCGGRVGGLSAWYDAAPTAPAPTELLGHLRPSASAATVRTSPPSLSSAPTPPIQQRPRHPTSAPPPGTSPRGAPPARAAAPASWTPGARKSSDYAPRTRAAPVTARTDWSRTPGPLRTSPRPASARASATSPAAAD